MSQVSTPPPYFLTLTPPPTGGYGKQDSFFRPQETLQLSGYHVKIKEVEFFEDHKEQSDVASDSDSITNSLPLDNSFIPSKGQSSTAATTFSTSLKLPRYTTLDKHGSSTSLVSAVDPTIGGKPFPFMRLPIFVRNKVYEHLLVIPAIICVRQKHTPFHDERKAFLYVQRRELLPGIAYALAQVKVDGSKSRFARFQGTNLNILRASSEIFNEARAIMYGKNEFEIVKPTDELAPQPDFSIRLFPQGYQRLIIKLNIRIRTFYDLHWLLSGGCNNIKNYYRSLNSLTLVLEIDSATNGFGREWARKREEKWVKYIERLHEELANDLFGGLESKGSIPTWVNLRVLFSGEPYASNFCDAMNINCVAMNGKMKNELAKREGIRNALVETWELFKKGGK